MKFKNVYTWIDIHIFRHPLYSKITYAVLFLIAGFIILQIEDLQPALSEIFIVLTFPVGWPRWLLLLLDFALLCLYIMKIKPWVFLEFKSNIKIELDERQKLLLSGLAEMTAFRCASVEVQTSLEISQLEAVHLINSLRDLGLIRIIHGGKHEYYNDTIVLNDNGLNYAYDISHGNGNN